MITTVKEGERDWLAITAPDILDEVDDVRQLRDALFEMLEIVLADDDLTFATPGNSLYIVASLTRSLTLDIERAVKEGIME